MTNFFTLMENLKNGFGYLIKNPIVLSIPVVILALYAFATLYPQSVFGSSIVALITAVLGLVLLLAGIRFAMHQVFVSQSQFFTKIKGDPRALSIVIAAIILGIALVISGALGY